MFKVGTKVVYPLQGAGVIEAIEEHKVLDKNHKYYVIKLVAGNMRIMVPVEFAEKIGLREVVEKEEFKKVFAILKGEKEDMVADWKVRYATNLEKMKTGSVFKMAEVARNLSWRSREKTLSVGEKRLFENACSAIATELAYSWKIEPQEADAMVKNILKEGADQQPTVQ